MANRAPPEIIGYSVGERLGQGSYATVYKALSSAPGPSGVRETVAIKCIDFARTNTSKTAKDNLVGEISILKKMRHPHIVQLIDFRWDKNWVYLITEFCSGGDLSAFIRSHRSLSEGLARKFLRQLALAIRFLRRHDLAHMDLKPQNILLTSRHNPVLKLADFGFAQHLREDLNSGTAFKGSPLYMAPEILHHRQYDARVDLWSTGVILYECLFGTAPFSAPSVEELVAKIKATTTLNVPTSHLLAGGIEYDISPQCQNLMHCLLRPDPKDRISFDEFFCHPFVDLKHAPSADAWASAQALALKADQETEPATKVRLYVEAVEFALGALEGAADGKERTAMRGATRLLLRKAEAVRESLRSSISCGGPPRPPRRKREAREPSPMMDAPDLPEGRTPSPREEMSRLPGLFPDVPQVGAAVTVVMAAESAAREERWAEALAKWELAIQTAIEILKSEEPSQRRDSLKAEVSVWLKFAEDVKKYIEISGLGLSKVAEQEEAVAAAEEEMETTTSNPNCGLM